jgi:Methyltransferase domain
MTTSPYAPERIVDNPDDCLWYHTTDLPGRGIVEGQWDLRGGEDDYTGHVDLAGKRVLEMGTASGHMCRHMESKGADVVAYDLSEKQPWDVVPFAVIDVDAIIAQRQGLIRRLNDSWWYAHRIFKSNAKVVYGTVYEVPASIGPVDVALYGAILLHVRDPFLALWNGLRLVKETAIVTEIVNNRHQPSAPGDPAADPSIGRPSVEFLPDWKIGAPLDTWWFLTAEVIQAMFGVLGFADTTVTRHTQKGSYGEHEFFTVVGRRTFGTAVGT